MITREENQWLNEVNSLSPAADAAQLGNDSAALKNIFAKQLNLLSQLTQKRAHDYDFANANTMLERMRQVGAAYQKLVGEKEKLGIETRVLQTEAIVCDVRGTFILFDKLQFVEGPLELEKAEKRYARVAKNLAALELPKLQVDGVKGMALRAQGIRLFGQGRFNIDAADLKNALRQLAGSEASLTEAAKYLQASADAGEFGPESAMYPGYCTSLSASAAAFACRCKADGKAFAGKYSEAAALLATQLVMMEKAKQDLLNVISKVADSLASRTAQEMELCDKRQKFFASLPSGSKAMQKPILFFILTLVAFGAQIATVKFAGVAIAFEYYVAVVAAALTVGGIGAGLVTWERGTKYFSEAGLGLAAKSGDNKPEPVS